MRFTLFFNMQLKFGRGRDFTCMTFGKCPYYIEHVPEQMPFALYQQCLPPIFFLHRTVASFGFHFILKLHLQNHFHFFMTCSILLYKRKMVTETRLFVLNHIILIRKCFFTSAYFSPFDLKSLLNQALSSLKVKFCFCD